MNRVVTLFGKILESRAPQTFVLDVEPQLGDAAEFGLGGQISLARRQCCEIAESPSRNGKDIVRIPEHVARLKTEASSQIPPTKRRR